jgi:hypothetical protein
MKTSFFAIFLFFFLFSCSPNDYEHGFHSWCITRTDEAGNEYGEMGVNCEGSVEIDELEDIDIDVSMPYPNPCANIFEIRVNAEEEDSVNIKFYDSPNRVVIDHEGFYKLWKSVSAFQFRVDSLKGLLGRLDSVVQIEFIAIEEIANIRQEDSWLLIENMTRD